MFECGQVVPNNAASVGVQFMVQVGYGPSSTLALGSDLSPGLKLTLGY